MLAASWYFACYPRRQLLLGLTEQLLRRRLQRPSLRAALLKVSFRFDQLALHQPRKVAILVDNSQARFELQGFVVIRNCSRVLLA